jgi:DNA-binding NarL/FixJ family response regulator
MAPTILIVDDHPSFRATARILLEAEGFHVVGEAEDGAGAVREAARLDPEVVLLDVQLPTRTASGWPRRCATVAADRRSSSSRAATRPTTGRSSRARGRGASSRRPSSRARGCPELL